MNIGSIVVIKPLGKPVTSDRIQWLPVDDEKTPYVVRSIDWCPVFKVHIVLLEEGVIGYNMYGEECGIDIKYCVEVLPPGEVELEEILENVDKLQAV